MTAISAASSRRCSAATSFLVPSGAASAALSRAATARARERRVGLGKTDRDLARLVSDRERIERGLLDQALGCLHQVGGNADVTLEGARKAPCGRSRSATLAVSP